jgi:hypothetical protein
MKQGPRIIISSLLAPIVSLLVPAILAILAIVTDASLQNDDAPIRAAGLILMVVLPISYPILVVFMATVGYILKRVHKLSLKNLLIVNGLVCIPIAFRFGWPSPFGLKDQMIGLTIFFPLIALCLGLGAICWWYLAVGQNRRVYSDE